MRHSLLGKKRTVIERNAALLGPKVGPYSLLESSLHALRMASSGPRFIEAAWVRHGELAVWGCLILKGSMYPKYLYRDYFKAKVYTIWVHGPLG